MLRIGAAGTSAATFYQYFGGVEEAVLALATDVSTAWQAGGQFLICGNGGSAADCQHLAAELAGRYLHDRPGWPALALTTVAFLAGHVSAQEEPGVAAGKSADALASELRALSEWLGLDTISVSRSGDFSRSLAAALGN